MTKQTKALNLALEGAANYIDVLGGDSKKYRQALEEALAQPDQYAKGYADAMNWKTANHLEHLPAQPEQKPVAWVVYSSAENDIVWADKGKRLKQNTPLYTTPPQPKEPKQEQGEPVAVVTGVYGGRFIVEPTNSSMVLPVNMALYAHPQRQRVVFPTMIRRMWSGADVQAWLDENVNKE